MILNSAELLSRLSATAASVGRPQRILIACSGGLDSIALAHCTAGCKELAGDWSSIPVLLLHIDHGLHPESRDWSDACERFARSLNVDFIGVRVSVSSATGQGPEAAAREARYAAFESQLRTGDWLLTAHHEEDQAETVLINLLRGSGPAGLAGIASHRPLGLGCIVRPFLDVSQSAVRKYAEYHALQWTEDPSNLSLDFDRNFLRHEVLPVLTRRWPAASRSMARSAQLAGEAVELMRQLAQQDLDALGGEVSRLPVAGLLEMDARRQRNLLRFAMLELALPTAPSRQLDRILTEVMTARDDAEPRVTWAGAQARRYRGRLYLLPDELQKSVNQGPLQPSGHDLGVGLGTLEVLHGGSSPSQGSMSADGLTVRARQGGEEIKPKGQSHTRKLKKLLQEEGVVPWMRERIPLVYRGEDLIAVGDLWIAANKGLSPDFTVRWNKRPALH